MSRRALVFLYSTPNLVGCGLALVGLVLFFTGVVGSLWPLVVGGLYLAGYLLTPRSRRSMVEVSAAATPDEVRRQLARLIDEVSPQLPREAVAHVRSIRDSIETTLSEEARVQDAHGDLLLIRRTALEYLPVAIRNYLDLPRTFARLQPVKDGKTAERLLIEQLALMDESMREIADDIFRQDTRTLVEHGYVLEERLRPPDPYVARR